MDNDVVCLDGDSDAIVSHEGSNVRELDLGSQRKYWQTLTELRTHCNYIAEYLRKTERFDTGINMFSAVVSSSSVGGWLVWKEYATLWSILIAASQILTSVRPYLPFKSRIQLLGGLLNDLEELFLQAEREWPDIAKGRLSDEAIHTKWIDLKSKIRKSTTKHFGTKTLPEDKKVLKSAQEYTLVYFKNHY